MAVLHHPGAWWRATLRGASTLKAPAQAQLQLLDLQAVDSRLDLLSHRRRTLPELAEIVDLETRRAAAADQLLLTSTEVDDLSREQRKADADVEQVKARRVRNQQRLDSGQVGSPRDLENLQHEIQTLERRISNLEDDELVVMERLEESQAGLQQIETQVRDLDKSLDERRGRRDAVFAEIEADSQEAREERQSLAASLPDDLLRLYDRLRAKNGGVGAAALSRGRCGGCRLELNPADLRQVVSAADDEVTQCEECGRILVRTAESGL